MIISSSAYKYRSHGPIYYEYGSLIITYDNADIAVKAFYMLREASYDDKNLLVLLLPNIESDMVPTGVRVSQSGRRKQASFNHFPLSAIVGVC